MYLITEPLSFSKHISSLGKKYFGRFWGEMRKYSSISLDKLQLCNGLLFRLAFQELFVSSVNGMLHGGKTSTSYYQTPGESPVHTAEPGM